MFKWVQTFSSLNGWIKLIFLFCVLGMCSNAWLVYRDLSSGGILLRLHLGFLLLYTAQVFFILLKERMVWVLAALQGILALLVNADFTFMPLTRLLGRIAYGLSMNVAIDHLKDYRYVVVSLAFTLQLLSAFALFSLLPKRGVYSRKQEKSSDLPSNNA